MLCRGLKPQLKWTHRSFLLHRPLYSRPSFSRYIAFLSVQLLLRPVNPVMAKRKSSTVAGGVTPKDVPLTDGAQPPAKRRASGRRPSKPQSKAMSTNPDVNANVLDAPGAIRASPDASEDDERMDLEAAGMDVDKQVKDEKEDEPMLANGHDSDSPLSDMPDMDSPVKPKKQTKAPKGKAAAGAKAKGEDAKADATAANAKKEPAKELQFLDPDGDDMDEAGEEEIQAALSRPPPVNSDYLPLPWKGRIGYVRSPIYALQ